jgi:hypothetical protein
MDEQLFLKGQRVITPEDGGEGVDAIRYRVLIKLDSGLTLEFLFDDITRRML